MPEFTVLGVVRAPSGQPVVGALVAAFSVAPDTFHEPPVARAVTDVRGEFGLALDLDHDYSISVTAEGYSPAHSSAAKLLATAEADIVTLTLGSGPSGVLRGRLLHADGRPATTGRIRVVPLRFEEHAVYLALPNERGNFRLSLGMGQYSVRGDAPGATFVIERTDLDERGDTVVMQLRPPARPAPSTVTEELRRGAIPVRMEPMGTEIPQDGRLTHMLCSARLVGIGESTHGSSEFMRLRAQLLFHLAKACGFSALLVEADIMAVAAVDDYVMTGVGDPVDLVSRVDLLPFTHEEFVAIVRAIRAYNIRAATPIRLVGIDPRMGGAALQGLLAWLASANVELHARVAPKLAIFASRGLFRRYQATSDLVRAQTRSALAEVRHFFDERGARSDRLRRQVAMQLHALQSVERLLSARPGQYGEVRDGLMAQGVQWAIEQHLPGARAVIAAHNWHVGDAWAVWRSNVMGSQLARVYGSAYVSVGVFFGTGSFRARSMVDGRLGGLENFSVGAPLPRSLEEQLDRVGLPTFLFDMRNLTEPMKGWLESDLINRELGAVFRSEAGLIQHTMPAIMYDVMAYIASVTAIVQVLKPTPKPTE